MSTVHAAAVALAMCVMSASLIASACSGSTHEQNAATAASYEAQQLACVDTAKTLDESRACRCAHPADDGHLPRFCKDGGP